MRKHAAVRPHQADTAEQPAVIAIFGFNDGLQLGSQLFATINKDLADLLRLHARRFTIAEAQILHPASTITNVDFGGLGGQRDRFRLLHRRKTAPVPPALHIVHRAGQLRGELQLDQDRAGLLNPNRRVPDRGPFLLSDFVLR